MGYRIVDCDEEPDYRYALTVTTGARTGARLVVVQCNPSRADGTRSDPTVGKVATWAEAERFARVTFVNLFARRSPHVEAIRHLAYAELVGPRNDAVLAAHTVGDTILVLAWGARLPIDGEPYQRRVRELQALCLGRPVHRVGSLVRGRNPRHGRMWNRGDRDLAPVTWPELIAGTAGLRP